MGSLRSDAEGPRRIEERRYARYIYEPTMTAISAEESPAKLLPDASGDVPLHRRGFRGDENDEQREQRAQRRENCAR
jgi:hypothetical protein